MKDFYKNTRQVIDTYNSIINEIQNDTEEIKEEQDEFLTNFCVHLAHALIKDTGGGQLAREELVKVADIINVVC